MVKLHNRSKIVRYEGKLLHLNRLFKPLIMLTVM